jgi:hypothetical protein
MLAVVLVGQTRGCQTQVEERLLNEPHPSLVNVIDRVGSLQEDLAQVPARQLSIIRLDEDEAFLAGGVLRSKIDLRVESKVKLIAARSHALEI